MKEWTGLGRDRIAAKEVGRAVGRAYAGDAKLSTDVARKRARSLNHACLNLDLL